MQFIDLSHAIEQGMTVFPGDPEPGFEAVATEPPWQVTRLMLGTHTGTHIDAASHLVPEGKTITQYPPERFLLTGIVVPVEGRGEDEPITAEALQPHLQALPAGGAVLLRTGWDLYWKSERYLRHPYLSPEAARLLVEAGASLVGIDALSVDSSVQGTQHAHATLLGSDVLIVENLARLDRLISGVVYQYSFLPLPLRGLDGSPIRALAWRAAS
ncbi:cyclase family protein [Thermogemmatispora sp.]|uniref:cyclase family protein n=1 Tax=Thermogemmatispora sp. TaxID=1968838 RepID=UPI0035E44D66